jgi:membrane protease YdiL (CAAX protease family)
MTPLPPLTVAAFAMLTVALATLWAPRVSASPNAGTWWVLPAAAALLLAQVGDLVGTMGLVTLFVLVTACRLAHEAPHGALKGFALAVLLATSAGLLAHAFPGFDNPRVLDGVRLGADAAPYTKYLNVDKGFLGLFLLGLVSHRRAVSPSRLPLRALAWRFGVVTVVVIGVTVALDFARWDPKLPSWWPLWVWSMAFLTALPEEAVFRHLIQGGLQAWLGSSARTQMLGIAASGLIFGLAHAAGGAAYVALATLAGLGYAWTYAVSGSLTMSIAAHTVLNTVHLLFFTYPTVMRG